MILHPRRQCCDGESISSLPRAQNFKPKYLYITKAYMLIACYLCCGYVLMIGCPGRFNLNPEPATSVRSTVIEGTTPPRPASWTCAVITNRFQIYIIAEHYCQAVLKSFWLSGVAAFKPWLCLLMRVQLPPRLLLVCRFSISHVSPEAN